MLQLTFNPGLTLTGFRTTRPWARVNKYRTPERVIGRSQAFTLYLYLWIAIISVKQKFGFIKRADKSGITTEKD